MKRKDRRKRKNGMRSKDKRKRKDVMKRMDRCQQRGTLDGYIFRELWHDS